MHFSKSEALFEKAQDILVGGVNSPVRAFKSVGGNPIFADHGEGAYIIDADGNRYVDYVGSYGPLILGHAPEEVHSELKKALDKGTTFGASTEAEIRLAGLVQQAFPMMEKIRFVSSGTEAVMSAIRLVRAFTGRTKIIKFAGCYHGHSDYLLAQAGSGLATLSLPGSAGVPEHVVQDTLIASYNDIDSLEALFSRYPEDIAAVLVEPVPGNMGVVLPEDGFLTKLGELTRRYDSLLVFDEVMSGFRERFGGAQHYFGVEPDVTCLGKVIGGGLPVGAYGARAEIMNMVAPLGPMYQAGTLSGNPIAMTAGYYTLKQLRDREEEIYPRMRRYTVAMAEGIQAAAAKAGVAVQTAVFGSMITPFLSDKPVTDYASASVSDTAAFGRLFWTLIRNGIYPPPSQFEAWFVSAVHGEAELENTIRAFEKAFAEIGGK